MFLHMSGDSMSAFVTALTGSLNSTALWGEAQYAVPLITAVAIFAFGYNIVRRVTRGASKGKFRM